MNDRQHLLLAVSGLFLLGSSLPGHAQDSAGSPATTRLQGVEVTGSRIKKSEGDDKSSVITLTAQDIQATGLASIGDILQRLSVSGSSLNTKFNSAGNFGFPADGGGVGSGSTTISLRNLGDKRTLVLVDGLRWVNESSASGISAAVDLNTIPASAVERIEILTDGASSLYGSDAIGGVVNIITKKSQDGAAANIYYGDYSIGNGQTYTGNVSLGAHDKKYDFFVDLSHYDQQAISSADWAQSGASTVPGTGTANGSSATPTGRFIFNPPNNNTYNGLCPADAMTGTVTCNITPNGVNSAFPSQYHGFTSADRFNFAPYNELLTPSRRTAIFAQGRYAVADNVRFYLKGVYQSRHSVNQAAPEPIFLGPGAGSGGLADTVGIDVSNPYNPLGYSLDPNTNEALVTRRPLEGGPRVYTQDVDTRYIATGFQGDFEAFDRVFSWDANYVSATNDAAQEVHGTYNIRHIANALGAVSNGKCVTDPVNCVPLNIFGGPGTITPAMLNYIQFIEKDDSRQSLDVFSANLSGALLTLPAGDLGFATGYEHRKLEGSYSPDSVVIAGDSNGVPSLPSSGHYDVDEGYAELAVPLLAKLPLARRLDLSLATRYSDYSTFGSTIKNKLGLLWQPVRDLTLRGTFAQGFRAPSIGESFGSPARFDATLIDPCSGNGGSANCRALGVPSANFQQANTQISVRTGGNAALRPETSKSTTAGAVYSPAWAEKQAWSDRVDFELTFYKQVVDNAIQAPDAQTQLNRCVASGDPASAFCQGITRGTTGDINGFNDQLRNLGTIKTQGYDLAITWIGPKKRYGRFSSNWQTTYTENYSATDGDTGLKEPRRVGYEVNDSGIPRWRSTLRLNWALQPVTASYALRYLSALSEGCAGAQGFASCDDSNAGPSGTNRLHSVLYSDVQASYTLPIKKYKPTITAGVNNLFQAGPPECLSCSLNGYDASNYDLPGRFAYVSAGVKF